MTKTILYQYMGTNGTLTTPIHLEDVYYIRKVQLVAGKGKVLTNGTVYKNMVTVPEEDETLWKEVKYTGQI